jgi:aspartate/methionine/tyrosine aminotransferase
VNPSHGGAFVRFSYARSADEMREAVTRIARWLPRARG